MQKEDYGSDTSDEDFLPSAEHSSDDDNVHSDEDLTGEVVEPSGEAGGKKKKQSGKKRQRPKDQPQKTESTRKRKTLELSDEEDSERPKTAPISPPAPAPVAAAAPAQVNIEPEIPKMSAEELEKKKKVEALWAMMNTKPAAAAKTSPSPSSSPLPQKPVTVGSPSPLAPQVNPASPASASPLARLFQKPNDKGQVTVTKTYDFAGKEVKITETVDAKALEQKRKVATTSALDQLLAKKSKINVLHKSKHDWESHVEKEGIRDDLQHHNKDGYLDRVSFLQRTDERQAEHEREIRKSGSRS